jgi:hypothetical protein
MEPNLKDWADALIHGITGDDNYSPKLVKWVEAELNDIADKYYQMGFEDGDKDGWWKEQENRIEAKQKNVYLEVMENLRREFPNGFLKRISDDE